MRSGSRSRLRILMLPILVILTASTSVVDSHAGILIFDYSVPITLTNSQSSSTPAAFEQFITFNPSLYASHESSDLGNIRFCADDTCNSELVAWLEGCPTACSASSTQADVWIQLTSSIGGAGGALMIYMVFLPSNDDFDGVYWGASPAIMQGHNNVAAVFGQAPFAYYPLEEGSGFSINDYSGNGNTASLVNSPTWLSGNSCVIGNCLGFNASLSQYVSLPTNFFPYPTAGSSSSPFTFSVWFKTNSDGEILGQQVGIGASPGGHVPAIYIGTNGKLYVDMFWSGATNQIISSTPYNNGRWHNLAVTYDGSTETAYVDGASIGSVTMTQVAYGSEYHYELGAGYDDWGGGNGGWFYFTGTLDDARFFTSVFTPARISTMIPPNNSMPSVAFGGLTPLQGVYRVTLNETGLPPGLSWTANVTGISQSTAANSMTFLEENGTYSYTIQTSGTFIPSPANGTISVTGGNSSVDIQFSQAKPLLHIPLTIINGQDVSTGDYEQELTVDSSNRSLLINSHWTNVVFQYQNGEAIPAWIESGNTNTSSNTLVWLKLTSIPANTARLLYMTIYPSTVDVLSPNGPTGEAPQLSSVYGEYDDGADVFTFYDNFAGTELNTELWTNIGSSGAAGSNAGILLSNGLTLSVSGGGTNPTTETWIYAANVANAELAKNLILDVSEDSPSTSTVFRWGFTNTIPTWFGIGNGVGMQVYTDGYWYATNANAGAVTSQAVGPYLANAYNTYSISYSQAVVNYSVNSYSTPGKSTTTNIPPPSSSMAIALTNNLNSIYIRWVRIRAYPLNGMMPSAYFGTIGNGSIATTTSTTPATSSAQLTPTTTAQTTGVETSNQGTTATSIITNAQTHSSSSTTLPSSPTLLTLLYSSEGETGLLVVALGAFVTAAVEFARKDYRSGAAATIAAFLFIFVLLIILFT